MNLPVPIPELTGPKPRLDL